MDGAAFLGPMPCNWVMRSPLDAKEYLFASVNDGTGEGRVADSRLDALPLPPG